MNVLIVGLGSIARKHIAALRQIEPGVCIYALRSSVLAPVYEHVRNVFSLEELSSVCLDFAVISNPTAEHKKTIEALLSLKCPLFIEKPLFHTLAVGKLLERVRQSGVLTYVACNLRFLECIRYVKSLLEERERRVNEVNVYCGSYLPEWRPGVNFKTVYSSRPELGGGVHIDLIYELDYLYWLLGMPSDVHRVFRNSSSLGINAYDYANYCLEYEDFCAEVVLNYYRRDARRTLEIVCEDGTWEVDLRENQVKKDGLVLFSSERRIADTYLSQMEYFMELVKVHAETSFNSFEEALEVLKICLGDVER